MNKKKKQMKKRSSSLPSKKGRGVSYSVTLKEDGQRFAQFLQGRLKKELSIRLIKTLLEKGQGRVNGRIEKYASRRLTAGDEVLFYFEKDSIKKEKLSLKPSHILFEDDEFLIINKLAGFPVTPTESGGVNYETILSRQLGYPLFAIHRLDRDTSGVLMFAKNKESRDQMVELFKSKSVKKTYLAFVEGKAPKKRRTLNTPLRRLSKKKGFERWGKGTDKEGLKALTHYEAVFHREGFSLLSVQPETGRTHQIRVHLSLEGYPILGDALYGVLKDGLHRHLLHAWKVEFTHPQLAKQISVLAPLPNDFKSLAGKEFNEGLLNKKDSGSLLDSRESSQG